MTRINLTTLASLALATLIIACAQTAAQRESVAFPQGYRDTMNLYTMVDRADGKISTHTEIS